MCSMCSHTKYLLYLLSWQAREHMAGRAYVLSVDLERGGLVVLSGLVDPRTLISGPRKR